MGSTTVSFANPCTSLPKRGFVLNRVDQTARDKLVEVVAEAGAWPLSVPEDWWPTVLGTGYSGTVEQSDVGDRGWVRRENLEYFRRAGVRSVESNVVYALAVRGRAGSA